MSFTAKREDEGTVDEDARVVKESFFLEEPLETICPVLVTHELMEAIIRGQAPDFAAKIKAAYEIVSKGKDVVIMEGANNVASGSLLDMSGIEIVAAFNAKALVVVRYRDDLVLDHLLIAKRVVGDAVIGGVVNTVPGHRMDFVEKEVAPFCLKRGIRIFGTLPQDRVLMSTSVGEIVEALGAEVLCGQDHMDELVENLLVGAMSVDSALKYLRRKPNKVVITGGDRPDLQLAALETSSKCLILTGNMHPSPIILGRAEELGVPVVLVKQDTLAAVDVVEGTFGRVRFHDEKKIRRFEALLNEHFDYAGSVRRPGPEAQEVSSGRGAAGSGAAPAPGEGSRSCRRLTDVYALEILDSRGNPTVQVEVILESGARGVAAVPSGASTGAHEAVELRDGDAARYGGKGVQRAVANVNETIAPELVGPGRPGAGGRRRAADRAGRHATTRRTWAPTPCWAFRWRWPAPRPTTWIMPLYRYLGGVGARTLPVPMLNILNGGKHAGWQSTDAQEFMVMPVGAPTLHGGAPLVGGGLPCPEQGAQGQGLRHAGGRRRRLRAGPEEQRRGRGGHPGGHPQGRLPARARTSSSPWTRPPPSCTRTALYNLRKEGRKLTGEQMVDFWADWCRQYPIISLEDGLAEDDWAVLGAAARRRSATGCSSWATTCS